MLGKPPRLAPRSSAPRSAGSTPLVIEDGARDLRRGDRLRRRAHRRAARSSATSPTCASARAIGADSVIGRGSCVDNDVVIGARVRIQTNVYVTGFSVVEDDVFLGPGVDDDQRRRRWAATAPTSRCAGATLRRACRIGGGAVLRARRRGRRGGLRRRRRRRHPRRAARAPSSWASPARVIRQVADEDLLEAWTVRLPHLPGAREPALARRRRLRAERRTRGDRRRRPAHGGAVAVAEVGRVWRRGSAPLPIEAVGEPDSEAAARIAAAGAEALGADRRGRRARLPGGLARENALLNLLGSFTLAWAVVRLSTHAIRRRGRFGPFGDLVLGQHHIHHFVPGIVLAFVAGGASVVARNSRLDRGSRSPSAPAWR